MAITLQPEESIETALSRLSTEAVTAVKEGNTILILDDSKPIMKVIIGLIHT